MKLLTLLADSVPAPWTVIVMSDRGLYAPWLSAKIVSLGWHPFMRINQQGHVRSQRQGKCRSLSTAAPEGGSAWCGKARLFFWGTESLAVALAGELR